MARNTRPLAATSPSPPQSTASGSPSQETRAGSVKAVSVETRLLSGPCIQWLQSSQVDGRGTRSVSSPTFATPDPGTSTRFASATMEEGPSTRSAIELANGMVPLHLSTHRLRPNTPSASAALRRVLQPASSARASTIHPALASVSARAVSTGCTSTASPVGF